MAGFDRSIAVTLVGKNCARAGPFVVGNTLALAGNHWNQDGDGVNTLVQDDIGYEQTCFIEFVSTQEKDPSASLLLSCPVPHHEAVSEVCLCR